jgi:hypothetical protein
MTKVLLKYYKRRRLKLLLKVLILQSIFGYVGIHQSFLFKSTQTELVVSNERKVVFRNFSYTRAYESARKNCFPIYTKKKESIALLTYNKLSKVNFDNISKKLNGFNKAKRIFRKEILPSTFTDDVPPSIAG